MILALVDSHDLRGFLNGDIPAPMPAANDYADWKRTDDLVRSWIISTLPEDRHSSALAVKTAQNLWDLYKDLLPNVVIFAMNRTFGKSLDKYTPLIKAARYGDWEQASRFFKEDPEAVTAAITAASETVLMIAVKTKQRVHFVEKLLDFMSPEDLLLTDTSGSTAFNTAVTFGNVKAVKLLVKKNPQLPYVLLSNNTLSLHIAAATGDRKMLLYILTLFQDNNAVVNPFADELGANLMTCLTESGFFDVALYLVKCNPKLALDQQFLSRLGRNPYAFPCGSHFNYWQRFIYSCVPVKVSSVELSLRENISSAQPQGSSTFMKYVSHKLITVRLALHSIFWKTTKVLVPQIKQIRETKVMHLQTQQLLKQLCMEITKLDPKTAYPVLSEAFFTAVEEGIHEVVEEILDSCPSLARLETIMGENMVHLAIKNRHENVFNLIYQCKSVNIPFPPSKDVSMNNYLHLAGSLGIVQKIGLRAKAGGAALQMQRELQWFKEVERLSSVEDIEERNASNKTPAMVFTETHEELVKEGEIWMKATSTACTVAAALILTVVFAAAITVPGGNEEESSLPFFSAESAFNIFAVADALALFSSTSSLLMFLSILTSRYSEIDFLYALPKRMIIGLGSLFLSIIFMMIAFAATLRIVFGQDSSWILIPVVAFSCIPITLFMTFQFPLLFNLIMSTYGPGIFGKQGDRILY